MRGLYWLLHMFGCPEGELSEEYRGKMVRCKKCGRIQFVFKQY